jgi:hypothetical protein
MRNHDEHPHETIGKIIILYILVSNFIDRRWEEKIFCVEW